MTAARGARRASAVALPAVCIATWAAANAAPGGDAASAPALTLALIPARPVAAGTVWGGTRSTAVRSPSAGDAPCRQHAKRREQDGISSSGGVMNHEAADSQDHQAD